MKERTYRWFVWAFFAAIAVTIALFLWNHQPNGPIRYGVIGLSVTAWLALLVEPFVEEGN